MTEGGSPAPQRFGPPCMLRRPWELLVSEARSGCGRPIPPGPACRAGQPPSRLDAARAGQRTAVGTDRAARPSRRPVQIHHVSNQRCISSRRGSGSARPYPDVLRSGVRAVRTRQRTARGCCPGPGQQVNRPQPGPIEHQIAESRCLADPGRRDAAVWDRRGARGDHGPPLQPFRPRYSLGPVQRRPDRPA